jgi:hypothetical protein
VSLMRHGTGRAASTRKQPRRPRRRSSWPAWSRSEGGSPAADRGGAAAHRRGLGPRGRRKCDVADLLGSTPPARSGGLSPRPAPRRPSLAARSLPRVRPALLARHPCSPRRRPARARAGAPRPAGSGAAAAGRGLSESRRSPTQAAISRESVEDVARAAGTAAQPHVEGLERDVYGHAMVDHCGPPLSAATTARSNSASNPGFTAIVAGRCAPRRKGSPRWLGSAGRRPAWQDQGPRSDGRGERLGCLPEPAAERRRRSRRRRRSAGRGVGSSFQPRIACAIQMLFQAARRCSMWGRRSGYGHSLIVIPTKGGLEDLGSCSGYEPPPRRHVTAAGGRRPRSIPSVRQQLE